MDFQILNNQPWLRVAKDLKKDGPFFCAVGLICGFIQIWGYTYFHKAEWGSELLNEHIALQSLLLMAFALVVARGLDALLSLNWGFRYPQSLITHLSRRTVAFGSVAACVMIGFAVCATLYGAYMHAAKSVLIALYFVAIAEFSANPLRPAEWSKANAFALGVIIATPFSL